MQFNALTLTLQNFIAAFGAGYGRLQGPINSLLSVLVGIEVVLLGLWAALGGGDHVAGVFKKSCISAFGSGSSTSFRRSPRRSSTRSCRRA